MIIEGEDLHVYEFGGELKSEDNHKLLTEKCHSICLNNNKGEREGEEEEQQQQQCSSWNLIIKSSSSICILKKNTHLIKSISNQSQNKNNNIYYYSSVIRIPSTRSSKKNDDSAFGYLWIDREKSGTDGGTSKEGGIVPLKISDQKIDLDIFVDHSIIEAFAQGGRGAVSVRVYPSSPVSATLNNVSVFSELQPLDFSYSFYNMTNCWIDDLDSFIHS